MNDEVVLVEIAARVAVITLNRPEARNALNRDLRKALPAAIERCDADDDVDVMILTGADPAFCAGVDLKEFGSGQVQQGEGFADVGERGDGRTPFRGALPPHTKPLIGAVNASRSPAASRSRSTATSSSPPTGLASPTRTHASA